MTIFTRQAVISDVGELHRIIQAAYRSNRGWTHEADLVTGERITQEELQKIITDKQDPIIVAELEGCIVGCISAEASHIHKSLQLPEASALIGLFSVDPDFQSKGIGKTLFHACLDYIKNVWKCKLAVLWVIEARQDLIKWYEKMGFKFTCEHRDFVFPEKLINPNMRFRVFIKELQ